MNLKKIKTIEDNDGIKYMPIFEDQYISPFDIINKDNLLDNNDFILPKRFLGTPILQKLIYFDFLNFNGFILNFENNINNQNWKVYMHINKTNNKKYIGITYQDINKRWRDGKGYSYKNQPHFYRAIQKYGWDNFKHIILHENIDNLNDAKILEAYYIKLYDNTNKEKGYNLKGYDENINYRLSEETKNKISKKAKKRVNIDSPETRFKKGSSMRGKKISNEHRLKLIEAAKKPKTKKHRKNLSETKKKQKLWVGEKNPNYGGNLTRGEKNGMFGKKQKISTKRKIGKINSNIFKDKRINKYNFDYLKYANKELICKKCNKPYTLSINTTRERTCKNYDLALCTKCMYKEYNINFNSNEKRKENSKKERMKESDLNFDPYNLLEEEIKCPNCGNIHYYNNMKKINYRIREKINLYLCTKCCKR